MGISGAILSNMKNMKKAKKIRAMSKEELLALTDEEFFDAVECVCEDAILIASIIFFTRTKTSTNK